MPPDGGGFLVKADPLIACVFLASAATPLAMSACESQCVLDCVTAPPGCHVEGANSSTNCSKASCGTVVCPADAGSSDAEAPNRAPEGGVEGGCQTGGTVSCPLYPSTCLQCLDLLCKTDSQQCSGSPDCVAAREDYLHCRTDGHLLGGGLILCLTNTCGAECNVLPLCP